MKLSVRAKVPGVRACSLFTGAIVAALSLTAMPLAAQEWQKQERIDLRPDAQGSASGENVETASVSNNGRWVIFDSDQSDLVAGDSNGVKDVFVRDRKTNSTRRLSMRPNGSQTTGGSYLPHASSDGRFVSFVSNDSGLVAADYNDKPDMFLLDRDTDADGLFDEAGATRLARISLSDAGAELYPGVDDVRGAVSDDGNSVAFASISSLDSIDTNGESDVYVRDRAGSRSDAMSVSTSGVIGDNRSPNFFTPPVRISHDGRFVAFSSDAENLVAGDSNFDTDIFVHDRDSDGNGVFDEPGGTGTERANVGPGNAQISSTDPFGQFDLDGSGRWLAFSSHDDLTGGDANPAGNDIYLNKLGTGAVTRIDFVSGEWAKGSGSCCGNGDPFLARDADVLIFRSSQLYNFSPGTSSSRTDVLAWSRQGGLTRVTDYPTPSSQDDGFLARPLALSSNGAYALVRITSAGAAYASQEGAYVYARNTIFKGGFEAKPLP